MSRPLRRRARTPSRTLESRTLLDGALVLERRPGFLFVWHVRNIDTLEQVEAQLVLIDAALADWGLDRLIFDVRDIDGSSPELVQRMWQWLSTHPVVVRVASVVNSPDVANRINLTGVTRGVRMRAFHQVPAAERWVAILT